MEEEQRLKRKMNEKKAKQEAERLYKVRPTYCPSRLNSCQNLFLFLCVQKKFLDNILVITMDFHAAKHTCMLQIAKKYFPGKFINQFSTGKSQKSLDGNKTWFTLYFSHVTCTISCYTQYL